ncbi:hypothetical protein [Agilicoccus flavus]|uniref:hypothetical protein n=1 Tax=Agilicoccus flavus TaxID=2775968 RepID=UPI001CF6F8E1|nr:hypothetical protein [Agilicoccus flavus]
MTTPQIAAALVVTDDARDLHGCLQSLRQLGGLLSEICIYGVGAPELTLAYARNAGAKVEVGDIDGGLAVARNRAACMTDAPWVLALDPNERLRCDPDKIARLVAVRADMVVEPDALSVEVSRGRGYGVEPQRQPRLYRPDRAHFVGAVDEHLVPVEGDRKLVALTPGADVLSVWALVDEHVPGVERERLERRHARACAALARLEAEGIGGNDLVGALVERSRVRRALGDDNGALDDLNRARHTPASDSYRWRARQDLATLLIEHGYYEGASNLIGQLRADGADEGYSDWLTAQVAAAQGQARDALRILRRLSEVSSADGRIIATPEILTETMVMATRLGRVDEALDCCLQLVARHRLVERHGRMLLKLWGSRGPDGLARALIGAGGPHLDDVAEGFDRFGGLGSDVAAALRAVKEEKPVAMRVM